jgi:hypothetical protein
MKKINLLTTLVVTLITGTSFASTEVSAELETAATATESEVAVLETSIAQDFKKARIRKAIMQRRNNYLRNKTRLAGDKNRKTKLQRHRNLLKAHNVDLGSSTYAMNREGELKFVPYYDGMQSFSNVSYIRPNRKQVFRRRAINYYREGGYAGKDELKEDVIYSSEHKVEQVPAIWRKQNSYLAEINTEIRNVQRNIGKSEQVATGYQKTLFRRGVSSRRYLNPYQSY